MKTFIWLCFWVLLLISNGNAQQWITANKFDFPGNVANSQIGGSDNHDNVYLTVQVNSTTHNNPSSDNYFLKVNANGQLVWSKKLTDYPFVKISTDSLGNSYLASNGRLSKFDSNGSILWEVYHSLESSFGTIIMQNDQIWLHGVESSGDSLRSFITSYDFNGKMISLFYTHRSKIATAFGDYIYIAEEAFPDPTTGNQGYLYKYHKNGNLLYVKNIPHTPTKIITDKKGEIYIYGWHDVFPININGINYLQPGNFLIKYDTDGKLLWHKIITGGLGGSNICVDRENNIYFTIAFSSQLDISGFHINSLPGGLGVIKFNPEGKVIWHSVNPSTIVNGANQYASPERIYSNYEGTIFITGRVYNSFNFGNTKLQTSNPDFPELFLAKMSNDFALAAFNNIETVPQNWKVYPNPSNGLFILKGETNSPGFFTITDINGKILTQKFFYQLSNKLELDLSGFNRGTYFLQINIPNWVQRMKLIKN